MRGRQERLLSLERRDVIGGAAVTEEFSPGFRTSTFSYVMSLLHPKIIRELGLRELGLTVLPATDLFCPVGTDDLHRFQRRRPKNGSDSSPDSRVTMARSIPEFDAQLNDAANVVRKLLFETPADSVAERLQGPARPVQARVEVSPDREELLSGRRPADDERGRLSVARWFEHSVTRAVLGYYCSIGTFAGPRTPGSAYVVLHHIMGEHEGAGGWGFIRGGMGAISDAIAESGRASWLADSNRCRGRQGGGGGRSSYEGRHRQWRRIQARAVVCNASCKVLFDRLLDPSQLPAEFLKHVRDYPHILDGIQDQCRSRGAATLSGL